MTHAIQIQQYGGPEVLEWAEVEVGEPQAGQARVEHTAVGLNFIDVYYRTGLYPVPLPSGIGSEAAGVVTAVGEGVTHIAVGDRVAYSNPPPIQSYSEECVMDARWLVKLPDEISDEAAASMMLKGWTAWYLLRRTYAVQPGDWVVLYAAAGGVGLIAGQWAKQLGARVIGIVGNEAKRELALAHGCEAAVLADDDVVAAVKDLTGGTGARVVYDSVGRDTFHQSLDCLRPLGLMVSFGNASGPIEPFSVAELAKRGSLYITRPTLWSYVTNREEVEAASKELFDLVVSGAIEIEVGQRFALKDAAEAHRALEGRRTTGSTVLIP
ncbi:MAG: NADPH:quinone reductase [Gammaproteobacteria bacterium]|nr:NADPH:quinone reductase [Gammaproteobacteria bacterium]